MMPLLSKGRSNTSDAKSRSIHSGDVSVRLQALAVHIIADLLGISIYFQRLTTPWWPESAKQPELRFRALLTECGTHWVELTKA
jgi:hypothetical protein